MKRVVLTDEHGVTSWTFLVTHPRVYLGPPAAGRRLLNAVRWVLRSGAQGRWNSLFKRFSRWSERGLWTELHQQVAHAPELQEVLLDSTIVRAHAGAAGQPQARRGRKPWGAPAAASAPRFMR